jgi:hypothetical protein
MGDLWDPERIRMISSCMTRYSEFLEPSHRIKLGMDGDTHNTYRSSEECPRATVLDVRREENGRVVFRAQLDGTDEIIERDNTAVNPHDLWEIPPEFAEAFRECVERRLEEEDESRGAEDPYGERQEPSTLRRQLESDDSFRGVQDQLEEMRAKLAELDESHRIHRQDVAKAVRALAGDFVRNYRGDTASLFSADFIDRYDEAALRVSAKETADEGAGPTEEERGFRGKHQTEKYDFSNYGPHFEGGDSEITTDES